MIAMLIILKMKIVDNYGDFFIFRVDSEYQVFCATMNWVNHDIANRRRSARTIQQKHNFNHIPNLHNSHSPPKLLPPPHPRPPRFIFDVLKHVRLPLVATKLLESYVNNCTDMSLKVVSETSP